MSKKIVLSLLSAFLLLIFFIDGKKVPTQEKIISRVEWDSESKQHHFWPDDPDCKEFTTRFAKKGSLPTRGLVSFPRSGNTWIRYLIEAATGLYTNAVYPEPDILKAGHYGVGRPWRDGSTILQKTHHSALPMVPWGWIKRRDHVVEFGGRAVLLIRNPYNSIISYKNYRTPSAYNTTFRDYRGGATDFVYLNLARWTEIIEDWLLSGLETKVHVIMYEELKEDPITHMRTLLAYLGLPVDEKRLNCIGKHAEGSFHKKTKQKDPYTSDQHRIIDSLVEKVDRRLRENLGWGLPLDKYELFNMSLTSDVTQ